MLARTRHALPATLLVVAGALAGCTDDDPGGRDGGSGGDPTTTATTATATTATDAPTASPEATEATQTTEPTPAAGQLLELPTVGMRLVDVPGWDVRQVGTNMSATLDGDQGFFDVALGNIQTVNPRLDDQATIREELLSSTVPAPKRVANRTFDGVECYVLEGRGKGYLSYAVGGVHGGHFFSVEFRVPADWPDGRQWIEQMLASLDIR